MDSSNHPFHLALFPSLAFDALGSINGFVWMRVLVRGIFLEVKGNNRITSGVTQTTRAYGMKKERKWKKYDQKYCIKDPCPETKGRF